MWNLQSSNKLCADRFATLSHHKHINNIQNVKPSIDNSAPKIPPFLKSRQKQEKVKEIKAGVIQYENRVLLDKMMEIERKKTQLNPETIAKKSFKNVSSLNTNRRIRDLKKINDENKALLKRLQTAHSAYDINKWIDSDRKHNVLLRNISQNARRSQHIDLTTARTPKNLTGRQFFSPQAGGSGPIQAGMYYEY